MYYVHGLERVESRICTCLRNETITAGRAYAPRATSRILLAGICTASASRSSRAASPSSPPDRSTTWPSIPSYRSSLAGTTSSAAGDRPLSRPCIRAHCAGWRSQGEQETRQERQREKSAPKIGGAREREREREVSAGERESSLQVQDEIQSERERPSGRWTPARVERCRAAAVGARLCWPR
jgi:hypothetical protein